MAWDKYTISDDVWFEQHQYQIMQGKMFKSFLDEQKFKYLNSTNVHCCAICGGELSRSFSSRTCGHGESIQSITYRCKDCAYDDVQNYGMGTTMEECDKKYKTKAVSLVNTIIKKYKEKENNENLH